MLSRIIFRIRSISLKWKLFIPFFLICFIGVSTIAYIGLNEQQKLIKMEERGKILGYYRIFLAMIDRKKEEALSLATIIAQNAQVQEMLSKQDRIGLKEVVTPIYQNLKQHLGISQLHFHTSTRESFLRFHLPGEYGESLEYRKTIEETIKRGKGVGGLEWGLTGLGIRGVAPVWSEGVLIGTVEVGYPFDELFLDDIKRDWGVDLTMYEQRGKKDYAHYSLLATTLEDETIYFPKEYIMGPDEERPIILIAPADHAEKSILLGSVHDYSGEVVALVQINVDRLYIEMRLLETRRLMIIVGSLGIAVLSSCILLVGFLYVRPIKQIVNEAREIAEGERETRLLQRPNDELGELALSLNMMLRSLKERNIKIEEYAEKLRVRVRERTADLVATEEKYRNLVENLPLIVYRLLKDGTIEFVNSYFTEKLGYTVKEAVGVKAFWQEKICGEAPIQHTDFMKKCWEQGEGFEIERRVRDKDGRSLTFVDHALPMKDKEGKVQWIDGIMIDITEFRRLEERALRAEEIRVLGEISERFAHELRNPLATVGGFARRLSESLASDTNKQKAAKIIVEDVARLENIVNAILDSIKPITLCISQVDLKLVLAASLEELEGDIKGKGIKVVPSIDPEIPEIQGDKDFLHQAFRSILRHALISIPYNETLFLSVLQEDAFLVTIIKHRMEGLADEDIEQFFFPRMIGKAGSSIENLPLAKIIIHRHNGKIDISREEDNVVILRVELPLVIA